MGVGVVQVNGNLDLTPLISCAYDGGLVSLGERRREWNLGILLVG